MTITARKAALAFAITGALGGIWPSAVAGAATPPSSPTILGMHCVAVQLSTGPWLRACAGVADDGTSGPFAVPLTSYGSVAVYHHIPGNTIAVDRSYYVYATDIDLYANHQSYDNQYLSSADASGYLTVTGLPETVPPGYVETSMTFNFSFSGGGFTPPPPITVWSEPVPTTGL